MTRNISKEKYERMVAAVPDLDPTADDFFKKLAKAGGVKPVTARKAWREGWPHVGLEPILEVTKVRMYGWAIPARAIRQVSGEPSLEAGAEEARKETNLRATLDAISARAEEGQMVGLARKATVTMLRGILQQMGTVNDQVGTMMQGLSKAVEDAGSIAEYEAVVRIWWRVTKIMQTGADTAHNLIKMERLLLGAPTDILGVDVNLSSEQKVSVGVDQRSITELAAQLENSRRAILRLRDPHPDDVEGIRAVAAEASDSDS